MGTIDRIGSYLQTSQVAKILELFLVFFAAFAFIRILSPLAGDNPVLKQTVIWFANVLMLILVWIGLRLRGQSCRHFGLSFTVMGWKNSLRVFLLSLPVFVLAILAFGLGSIIMANIGGAPQSADLSAYDYLKNNLGMFLLTLAGVLVVASFGEEVIYRAFLINRISELWPDNKKAKISAVFISSIVFGLVHYQWGAMGMVQTGFMGLALGLSYVFLKNRLWVVILAHAYMDIILMVQLYLA